MQIAFQIYEIVFQRSLLEIARKLLLELTFAEVAWCHWHLKSLSFRQNQGIFFRVGTLPKGRDKNTLMEYYLSKNAKCTMSNFLRFLSTLPNVFVMMKRWTCSYFCMKQHNCCTIFFLFSHSFWGNFDLFIFIEFPGYSCLLHVLILGPWSPRTEFLRQEQSWINPSAYDLFLFVFTKSDERSTQIWKFSTFLECTVFCTTRCLANFKTGSFI